MKSVGNGRGGKLGRPLSFNREAALEKAMLAFWRHGYEGTSLAELTAALGVTPPSVYAAFGDKKHLFLEAVDLYLSGPVPSEAIVRDATTAREAAWRLLITAATAFTGEETPPGCLLAATAGGSAASADVQADLTEIRRGLEARLRDRIEDAIATGELKPDTDGEALAGLVAAVIQGLSALARDGASRLKLMATAEAAMRAWPE
jgi:AcrR family transcriptional regulator